MDDSLLSSGASGQGATDESTPATSPSASDVSRTPKSGDASHTPASEKPITTSLDLSDYLALGCLCFEDVDHVEHRPDGSKWEDVHRLPSVMRAKQSRASDISKLLSAGWIRMQVGSATSAPCIIYRVYLLPGDVGHRFVDRQNKRLWLALENLLPTLDVSPETWQGVYPHGARQKYELWATGDDGSLFYMFNKLASPSPAASVIGEKYAREALEDLLDPASSCPGLKTVLYPYQRRSAGLMLQREAAPKLDLDPRLEARTAPDGSTFYYGARDFLFLRQPRYYETCRGGILAETMGLGKTVILLAMILATKHHPPQVPDQYNLPDVRSSVASLSSMAIASINRKSIPWRVEFERVRHASGYDMKSCAQRLEAALPTYVIPIEPARWNRKTILPMPRMMITAPTTLIVVPRNLCKQWQSEIAKHVEENALRVLIMEDLRTPLPTVKELRTFDVVLFSRNRFELESKDGADERGRRASSQLLCRCPYIGSTRTRDCDCVRPDRLYDSSLKHLHFKRLIIDEGHFFSNNNTIAVNVANKLVTADHRWVVSGTPAKDLLGVEVDLSAAESLWENDTSRSVILDQRRSFSHKEDVGGAIKSLGILASSFLKLRPWYAEDGRKADWDEYIYRHEDLRRRTYSGFSSSLRRTLEAMVVKTQPEDVERDIELPPLSHEIVRLAPSFYDKLTANLFTLVLTANAVTSERKDADYLFHKNSQKARYQLINNLRQSAFCWTGFSEADVVETSKNSSRYLAKEGTFSSDEDRHLLKESLVCVDTILTSSGWLSMSRSHETGLFVDGWPAESAEHWAFDDSQTPLLTGISQILAAQKYVNERTGFDDPSEGLGGAGIRALAPARYGIAKDEGVDGKKRDKPILTKSGIPNSILDGEPSLKRRGSPKKGGKASQMPAEPQRPKASNSPSKPNPQSVQAKLEEQDARWSHGLAPPTVTMPSPATPQIRRTRAELDRVELPSDSACLQSRIVGTTSAKLSYLLSQVLKHHEREKLLIFYDGDNTAYYIAQALELMHIKHEIYAKSLAPHLKSEYVVRFNEEESQRVLLMDVKQAAFGLNLCAASRIYFVNPACRPNIEAQAIKRAHRIGQTRKVFIETLVLQGTIEEKMMERSKRMTRSEHMDAKVLEDDGGMREIIQSARPLPVTESETLGHGQMAPLEIPQRLWARPGWRDTVTTIARPGKKRKRESMMLNDVTDPDEEMRVVYRIDDHGREAKRRMVPLVSFTSSNVNGRAIEDDGEREPLVDQWRTIVVESMATSSV